MDTQSARNLLASALFLLYEQRAPEIMHKKLGSSYMARNYSVFRAFCAYFSIFRNKVMKKFGSFKK